MADRELLNIVMAGHVDHGKSSVIGRLLADTGSLPQGKLDQVKAMCEKNARPFEYAFLLDALKDEQSQGITIDAARCFFKTAQRDYILIDAPGHVEFLKNMVTGAARADAALLVIDAHEGIQENSRRHGYLLSMLGVRQLVVLVNKMDKVAYDLKVFARVEKEYREFLGKINVHPLAFVPVSAREGVNLTARAPWYSGRTVIEHIDAFTREGDKSGHPLRVPIQDVYKFTADGDDRRIFAGTVLAGTLRAQDRVVFYPSRKKTSVQSLEEFNRADVRERSAGHAVGLTLKDELYLRPGELLVREGETEPLVSVRFRANLFWMGRSPLIAQKRYKLKIGTARTAVFLAQVLHVLDASELSSVKTRGQVDRHDVAEVILETAKPVAFDLACDSEATGRFVIVDNYEIAGGGIILERLDDARATLQEHIVRREAGWETSAIPPAARAARYGHQSKFIVIVEPVERLGRRVGQALEKWLVERNFKAYGFGLSNLDRGLDADLLDSFERSDESIRRLGELARIMTDSGQIFITALPGADDYDLETLKALNAPDDILIVRLGESDSEAEAAVKRICRDLRSDEIIPEYSI